MSNLQNIDWSGIRAAAVVIGVREAARRAAVNLTPKETIRFTNRVMQRSKREGWLVHKKAALSANLTEQSAKPLSANVSTGADAAVSRLKEDSSATRIGFSKAARKVAESLPEMSEVLLMDKDTAQAAKHWHGIASGVHGWEQSSQGGSISLNILTGQAAVQINTKHQVQE